MKLEDVWAGRESAAHILRLIEGLMFETHSRVRASELGDMRHVGFDQSTFAMAKVHDWLAAIGHGLSGKQAAEGAWYPLPKMPEETRQDLVAPTIADFNVSGFMALIANN